LAQGKCVGLGASSGVGVGVGVDVDVGVGVGVDVDVDVGVGVGVGMGAVVGLDIGECIAAGGSPGRPPESAAKPGKQNC